MREPGDGKTVSEMTFTQTKRPAAARPGSGAHPQAGRASKYLAIYLNDHLAGSTTGIELVRRAAREHRGSELGAFLHGLAREIHTDRETLKRIMDAAGVEPDRLKVAAAWLGEKAGRLKLNGHVLRRSPYTPFIELEALKLGIHGKELLWRALQALPAEQRPPGVDYGELIERAERQQAAVEEHRIAAGRRAMAADD
jgi:hypothetical protein